MIHSKHCRSLNNALHSLYTPLNWFHMPHTLLCMDRHFLFPFNLFGKYFSPKRTCSDDKQEIHFVSVKLLFFIFSLLLTPCSMKFYSDLVCLPTFTCTSNNILLLYSSYHCVFYRVTLWFTSQSTSFFIAVHTVKREDDRLQLYLYINADEIPDFFCFLLLPW